MATFFVFQKGREMDLAIGKSMREGSK